MTLLPETRDRIVDLAKNGTRPCLIRGMLSERVPIYAIYAAIKSARERGVNIPPFERALPTCAPGKPMSQSVRVDVDVLKLLDPCAQRRGITVANLASRLLSVVALEDMVDAVLDDDGAA